jgi:hypothetical protein
VLLSQVIGAIAAPLSGLIGTIEALYAEPIRTIGAVADKVAEASPAPKPAPAPAPEPVAAAAAPEPEAAAEEPVAEATPVEAPTEEAAPAETPAEEAAAEPTESA